MGSVALTQNYVPNFCLSCFGLIGRVAKSIRGLRRADAASPDRQPAIARLIPCASHGPQPAESAAGASCGILAWRVESPHSSLGSDMSRVRQAFSGAGHPDRSVARRPPATRACSLKGEWLKPRVMNLRDSAWFEEAAQRIVGEMPCSPIILPDGGAVSVEGRREGGPNPMLAANLPAWLLEAATSS